MKKSKHTTGTKDDGSFMFLLNHFSEGETTPGRVARSFRINAGLTLSEVARLTKIPNTNLSKIENSKTPMTSKYAEKIAAVYGIHPAVILYPEGYSYVSKDYDLIRKKANNLRKMKEAI